MSGKKVGQKLVYELLYDIHRNYRDMSADELLDKIDLLIEGCDIFGLEILIVNGGYGLDKYTDIMVENTMCRIYRLV